MSKDTNFLSSLSVLDDDKKKKKRDNMIKTRLFSPPSRDSKSHSGVNTDNDQVMPLAENFFIMILTSLSLKTFASLLNEFQLISRDSSVTSHSPSVYPIIIYFFLLCKKTNIDGFTPLNMKILCFYG